MDKKKANYFEYQELVGYFKAKIEDNRMTREELVNRLAEYVAGYALLLLDSKKLNLLNEERFKLQEKLFDLLEELKLNTDEELLVAVNALPEAVKASKREGVEIGKKEIRLEASKRAKAAANLLHDKPGSSRDKQAAIRAAWATGKYTSRDLCAEQESAALNMAIGTARRALRNTPDPA